MMTTKQQAHIHPGEPHQWERVRLLRRNDTYKIIRERCTLCGHRVSALYREDERLGLI